MRRDATAALRLSLSGHLSLRKSRLESFCVLVVGVLLSRTVNLGHLACLFPTRAEIASNYRRLQRFFEQVILDTSQLARVIVKIAGLGSGPWLLALDRTCWKFGRYDINVLMLAIIRNGIAIPVMWDVLGRAGTSTTAQRSALLSRFCAVFGETAIAGLIADREFIGTAWMTSPRYTTLLRAVELWGAVQADGPGRLAGDEEPPAVDGFVVGREENFFLQIKANPEDRLSTAFVGLEDDGPVFRLPFTGRVGERKSHGQHSEKLADPVGVNHVGILEIEAPRLGGRKKRFDLPPPPVMGQGALGIRVGSDYKQVSADQPHRSQFERRSKRAVA